MYFKAIFHDGGFILSDCKTPMLIYANIKKDNESLPNISVDGTFSSPETRHEMQT